MITRYPYSELGNANFGWLHAHYHFSFSNYYNPKRLGFGHLKVINDDIIRPQQGFATHSHSDMEIITYVKTGAITHTDSLGNKGKTLAGDVQVMSAGSGISHSEYNLEDSDTTLYQIWIEPKIYGIKPTWDSCVFPKNPIDTSLHLLVSGDGLAPLHINQDARIYAGTLQSEQKIVHNVMSTAYVLVSSGTITLNNTTIEAGDGSEIVTNKNDDSGIAIYAHTLSEILIIEV